MPAFGQLRLSVGSSLLILAGSALSASAAQISVDFQATNAGGQPAMAASETAGVFPQQNWNSLAAASNAGPNALVDSAGAATGANIAWSTSNNYTVGGVNNNAAGNQKMLNGYIDTNDTVTNTFTVTNLPASIGNAYSVIVYVDGDGTDNRFGTYSIAGVAGSILVRDNTNGVSTAGLFDNATTDQLGNFILFTNVPRDANGGFVLSAAPTAGGGLPRAGVSGIQISTPEPACLGLLGLGTMGLLARRRR